MDSSTLSRYTKQYERREFNGNKNISFGFYEDPHVDLFDVVMEIEWNDAGDREPPWPFLRTYFDVWGKMDMFDDVMAKVAQDRAITPTELVDVLESCGYVEAR